MRVKSNASLCQGLAQQESLSWHAGMHNVFAMLNTQQLPLPLPIVVTTTIVEQKLSKGALAGGGGPEV